MNNEAIARQLESLATQLRANADRDSTPATAFQPTSGVYALVDPRSDRVMYVGQSLDIDYRFRQHLGLKSDVRNKKKSEWICRLKAEGLVPNLLILERCKGKDLERIEREKIHHFLSRGECELNRESYGLGNGSVIKTGVASRDDWYQLARKYMAVVRLLDEIATDTGRLCGGAMKSRVLGLKGKVSGLALALKESIKSKFGQDKELLRVLPKDRRKSVDNVIREVAPTPRRDTDE